MKRKAAHKDVSALSIVMVMMMMPVVVVMVVIRPAPMVVMMMMVLREFNTRLFAASGLLFQNSGRVRCLEQG